MLKTLPFFFILVTICDVNALSSTFFELGMMIKKLALRVETIIK